MNGNDSVKSIVNKQYNTPVNIYSDKTIAETLSAQTEVLAGGVLGLVCAIVLTHRLFFRNILLRVEVH